MTKLPEYDDDQQGMFKPTMENRGTPDFKTYQERDAYFREHADYFTLVKKAGVGHYDRSEYKSLAEAEKAAQVKQLTGGGGWMIYAVIGQQSAFVKAIK